MLTALVPSSLQNLLNSTSAFNTVLHKGSKPFSEDTSCAVLQATGDAEVAGRAGVQASQHLKTVAAPVASGSPEFGSTCATSRQRHHALSVQGTLTS